MFAFTRRSALQFQKEDGWLYGPEISGCVDPPEGGFGGESGAVKRQVYGLSGLCSSLSINAVLRLGRSIPSVPLQK